MVAFGDSFERLLGMDRGRTRNDDRVQVFLLEHVVKVGIYLDALEVGFGPSAFISVWCARRHYQCPLRQVVEVDSVPFSFSSVKIISGELQCLGRQTHPAHAGDGDAEL